MNNLIESLPDFDDMDKMAKIVASSKASLEDKKNQLDEHIARCVKESMTNRDYWLGSKPPTMSYIERVVVLLGNTDNDARILKSLREEIAMLIERLNESKMILDNMKDRIEVWRTMSANGRKVNV